MKNFLLGFLSCFALSAVLALVLALGGSYPFDHLRPVPQPDRSVPVTKPPSNATTMSQNNLTPALPAVLPAQWNYTTNKGTISITKYIGSGGSVSIPSTINGLPVATISDCAFSSCRSLTNVTIPDSVTSIGREAFAFCYSLTNATIGHNVTSIGHYAFRYCTRLASITISRSVTNIGSFVFGSCPNLTAITVDSLNALYSSADGILFDKNQTRLIKCPERKAGSYSIPKAVTSIATAGFYDCTSLTSVTIPASVTNIGGNAFWFCTKLTAITVAATNSVYGSLDGVLFNKNQTSLVQCPGGKAGSYTIPDTVTSIEGGASWPPPALPA